MNDQQRVELLAAVEALSRRYPHWRLGQLVANVAGWADQEIWDIEDQQLLTAAQSHLQQSAASNVSAPATANSGRTSRST